jgi:hypothetical protein
MLKKMISIGVIGIIFLVAAFLIVRNLDNRWDKKELQNSLQSRQLFKGSLTPEEQKMSTNIVEMVREMERQGINGETVNLYLVMEEYAKTHYVSDKLDENGRFYYEVRIRRHASQGALETGLLNIDRKIALISYSPVPDGINRDWDSAIVAIPFYNLRQVAKLEEVHVVLPIMNPLTQ